MKGGRWVATEAVIAASSMSIGWLIPDGLSLAAQLLGQPPLVVTPVVRLLSAMVTFMFAVSLQLMLFMRSQIRALQAGIPETVATALGQATGPALDSSLLRVLLDNLNGSQASLPGTYALLRSVTGVLTRGHVHLRDAYAMVIERALTGAEREIEKLESGGLEADILDHLEVTQRLCEGAQTYLQIQRRAFMVPEEWTQEWMRFLTSLPARGATCEYIVLLDRTTLIQERARLESMNRYLTRSGWSFKYCDLRDVSDSFGGVLPTEWNTEVIDERVIKLHEMPRGQYHGGARLRMLVYVFGQKADMQRYIQCVRRSARRFTPALFTSGTP
ncbi:hypothetical protein [Nonomuraea sp. LPB2021202275-12-8]|uniref:hypothetical protein n=1 Tax=Nonomuraea sp. LPB2021202275-12-8 TaxID=3120159 RepID=UPI00300D292F